MKKKIKIHFLAAVLIMAVFLVGIIFAADFYFVKNKTILNISGAVVPHHNLVANKRADFFSELAGKINPPETIILVSPNHFSAGKGNIQTTDKTWNLSNGKILADKNVVSFLTENNLAEVGHPPNFEAEHGIYNILLDLHNNFPNAKLVPIIFENPSENDLEKLEAGLLKSCKNCFMVASVDFSHYQPALLSQLHDDKSIRDLQNLDAEDLQKNAEVDSGQALALLAMWAKDHNTFQFSIYGHTSSDIIFNNPDLEGTTHVFGWYEEGKKVLAEQSVSFIFGGDTMFARGIDQLFGKNFNNAFSNFGDRIFWGTDASVINLEGAITSQPFQDSFSSDNFTFKFSPEIIKTLSFLHVSAASQANNHSENAGQEGLLTTRSLLAENNIQPFGGPVSSSIFRVAQFKGNGLSLTIIGINMTFPGQDEDAKLLVPIIKNLKKDPAMRVIVIPHWGEEYLAKHTADQETVAHLWATAGADLIVGGHPHVVEDTEIYHGVPIFYSIGNLLFDQPFSKQTKEGILVAGKFTKDGIYFFALPTQTLNFQPQLATGAAKAKILDKLYLPFKNYLEKTPAGDIIKISK